MQFCCCITLYCIITRLFVTDVWNKKDEHESGRFIFFHYFHTHKYFVSRTELKCASEKFVAFAFTYSRCSYLRFTIAMDSSSDPLFCQKISRPPLKLLKPFVQHDSLRNCSRPWLFFVATKQTPVFLPNKFTAS